jgi:hypothetical protein
MPGQKTKACTNCRMEKPVGEFSYRGGREKSRRRSQCKVCIASLNLQRYHTKLSTKEAHYKAHRKHSLKKYGLTPEGYDELLHLQDGVCLICRQTETREMIKNRESENLLVVDHCHTSGKVRGLLCHSCNAGLGHFKDRTDLLFAAIKYLEET